MRKTQKIGLVVIFIGQAQILVMGVIPYASALFTVSMLTWLFLPPIGAFVYVYPRWEESVNCPLCGAKNKVGYKKCSVCGMRPFVSFQIQGGGAVYSKRGYNLRVLV